MTKNLPENNLRGLISQPLIPRAGIVRLGAPDGPEHYYPSNHGSVGIVSVRPEQVQRGWVLRVVTDFRPTERVISARADVDYQLAQKGVVAGISGGGTISRVAICATRPIPKNWRYPDGTHYAAGALLPPQGAWADPELDNLWLSWLSFDSALVQPGDRFDHNPLTGEPLSQ